MSYQIADFAGQVAIQAAIHHAYPNRAAELNAIAAALATDTATHDATITTAPAALQPGAAGHSPFTNDVLLIVNAGKGGNLAPLDMGNAITAGLANEIPPVNTTVPAATGTGTVGQTLSVTNGNWQYVPTSYAYQWLRNGRDRRRDGGHPSPRRRRQRNERLLPGDGNQRRRIDADNLQRDRGGVRV